MAPKTSAVLNVKAVTLQVHIMQLWLFLKNGTVGYETERGRVVNTRASFSAVSILGPGYPDEAFRGFTQSLQASAGVVS
jgi:hypothetical protein